ncbi:hypothetical protein B0H14DRAFT_2616075 [Mycena olivaceomarginata]|nr:hypothetical protein B0H14DRAFT_2616075 [Mycena olivaceomarginata]
MLLFSWEHREAPNIFNRELIHGGLNRLLGIHTDPTIQPAVSAGLWICRPADNGSNGVNLVPLIRCTIHHIFIYSRDSSEGTVGLVVQSGSLNSESFVPFKILSSRAAQIDAKRLINVSLVKPFPTGMHCYPVRKAVVPEQQCNVLFPQSASQ